MVQTSGSSESTYKVAQLINEKIYVCPTSSSRSNMLTLSQFSDLLGLCGLTWNSLQYYNTISYNESIMKNMLNLSSNGDIDGVLYDTRSELLTDGSTMYYQAYFNIDCTNDGKCNVHIYRTTDCKYGAIYVSTINK